MSVNYHLMNLASTLVLSEAKKSSITLKTRRNGVVGCRRSSWAQQNKPLEPTAVRLSVGIKSYLWRLNSIV